MNENLYQLLRECFPQDLSQTFLESEHGDRYSYRDLDEETARAASFLTGLGLRKGDRVLAQVDKSPQAFFLCLASIRAGLIYVPLNPAHRTSELRYFLDDAQPRVAICRPGAVDQLKAAFVGAAEPELLTLDGSGGGTFVEKTRDIPAMFHVEHCEKPDVAALMYTSGTTGRPKGAMITHGNLAANAWALHAVWRWTPSDVLLHTLPLYHVHGLFIACLSALRGGARMIFLPQFAASQVVRTLPRCTVFMGVPTYYTRLLEQPRFLQESCGSVRLFISGSAPLLEQTFAAFGERAGHAILERYGMTEAGVITSNTVEGPRLAGQVGEPLPGVSVRVADEAGNVLGSGQVGEVQIQGENVSPGYWRKPEDTAAAFTADGFFRSGDLGRWSPSGSLQIVGRLKDLVITGGLNVYPKEIEMTLDQIEGVAESAVIGVPHPDFGEAVVAVVVREQGAESLTENAVIAHLKKVLANYKVPKRVFFSDELPRNTMGKVQKNLLRSRPEYAELFRRASPSSSPSKRGTEAARNGLGNSA